MVANYVKRLDPIVCRLTPKEIEALSDEDLFFLLHWVDGPSASLRNLAMTCRDEERERQRERV